LSYSEPLLIKAYKTFDNKIVLIDGDSFNRVIEKFEKQENIPDLEILPAKFLSLESTTFSPVYEIIGEGEIYKLKDLEKVWVRCSNI